MAHASGHANEKEIKEVIERINPKRLFPIHTNDGSAFKEITNKVELVKVGEKVGV